jgi:predicted O-linked N-acetylglucosamine transferase (SPINDLY family)
LDPVIPEETLKSFRLNRADLGLPDDRVVLAALNNSYKITEPMWAAWMEVLNRAPETVMWLIDDNPIATANLKRAAAAHRIKDDRLVFTRRLGFYQYAASLSQADIYLDTFPYNCGSTARDVVRAGLPIVSMAGRTVVSRMAASAIAARAKNEQHVCTDLSDYVRQALACIDNCRDLSKLKLASKSPSNSMTSCSWDAESLDQGLIRFHDQKLTKKRFI